MDAAGCAWGASLRIRVGLNVTKPLKRALKVRSTSGAELHARLTYERLANVCYLCGFLGHIDKYCALRFDEGFQDPRTEIQYGSWLRAPIPLRGRSQVQSQGAAAPSAQQQHRSSARTDSAIFGDFGRSQMHNNRVHRLNSSTNLSRDGMAEDVCSQGKVMSPANRECMNDIDIYWAQLEKNQLVSTIGDPHVGRGNNERGKD
ncbi:UNVERIFIED_CONTAM: hypothetical protein Slati_2200800 [Sesamum latifolium]|uniref:Zinc knuckle CX2CX4HX4C domain-containing protein n=1 Tax=Sesamum latifolium TaxID=2727402 RepID=A0AAW2WVI6_9LAMI